MKKYSMFSAPYMSFFSAAFYRDVYTNWKGTAFLYLLFLQLVVWIPMGVFIQASLDDAARNYMPELIAQVPELQFAEGKMSTPEMRPYEIRDPEEDALLALIDTTGAITSLEDTEARVLIMADKALVRESAVETRVFSFKEIKNFTLTGEVMHKWVEITRQWLVVLIYPFCAGGAFLFRVLQALVYAAVGMFFATFFRAKGDFLSYIRVAVMAVTPCIIIGTIFDVTGGKVPMRGLVFFVVAMSYLYFATRAVFGNTTPPPLDERRTDWGQ